MPDNILSPKPIAAEAFTDAAAAVARLAEIYERNVSFLRAAFEAYVRGEPARRARACRLSICQDHHGHSRPPRLGASLMASSPAPACTRRR